MKLLAWSNRKEELYIPMMALSLNLEALPPNWEQAKEEDRLSYSIAILLRPKKQPPIIS